MNPVAARGVTVSMDPPLAAAHSGRSRTWRRLVPAVCAGAILLMLVRQVGTPAFVEGLCRVNLQSVFTALALTLVATVASAWRWRLVAGALGLEVPLRAAVPAYYRSQFLNSTMPGGVVGDVHRGVVHGTSDVGSGLRAVGWERAAGQMVQLALAVAILVLMPSQLGAALPLLVGSIVVLGAVVLALLHLASPRGRLRGPRALRIAAADLRVLVIDSRVWPGVLAASVVVIAAHLGTFLVAARAAGVTLETRTVLQLAVVVLLAMAVPLNVAGFGPREGVAAWGFSTAGAGAASGVTVAVVYGVLAFLATTPGLLVLLRPRRRPVEVAHG